MSILTLREARAQSGLTAARVALAVGCDRATLYRIEDGKTLPKRKTARALFELYKGVVPLVVIYDPEFSGDIQAA